MMDCDILQEALNTGEPLTEAHRVHQRECSVCTLTLAAPTFDFDALLEAVEADQAAEKGLQARLRALSTTKRWGILGLVGVSTALGVLFSVPRVDLALYPTVRMMAELGALTLLFLGFAHLGLRPAHRPPLSAGTLGWIILLGITLPFITAVLPLAHLDHPACATGLNDALLPRASACLLFGGVMALPLMGVGMVVHRRALVPSTLIFLGLAGGMVGLFALTVHCPITHPLHLLLGHGPVAIAAALLAVGLGSLSHSHWSQRGSD